MSFESWLESKSPNTEQLRAIKAVGDLAIRAAAGSGKTSVLVQRILWLLAAQRGRDLDFAELDAHANGGNLLGRIVATTFTRKAAGELRERLNKSLRELVLEDEDNALFWKLRIEELPMARIGTIDSLAGSIVRQMARAGCPTSLGADFEMLDSIGQEDLMQEALRQTALDLDQGPDWAAWEEEKGRGEILKTLENLLTKSVDPAILRPDPEGNAASLGLAIIACYQSAHGHYLTLCREHGLFDFSQVSEELGRLLETHTKERLALQKSISHILVDEFQDTNDQQWRMISHLSGGPGMGRLTLVGDPQQAIYQFRGADPGVFERIWDLFTGLGADHTVTLQNNYRTLSPLPIDFINQASQLAFEQTRGSSFAYQALRPGAGNTVGKGALAILLGRNDPDWCELLASKLIERRKQTWFDPRKKEEKALVWRDMAILCRSRTCFLDIADALERQGIPYEIPGGSGFWQTQEVRDQVNLVLALCDDSDNMAMAGVLRGPFGRLDDAVLLWLTKGSNSISQRLSWLALKAEGEISPLAELPPLELPPLEQAKLEAFIHLWRDWTAHVDRLDPVDLIHRALRTSDAWHCYASLPKGPRLIANINQFLTMLWDMTQNLMGSLAQAAAQLRRLVEDNKEKEAVPEGQVDAVQLLTVHSAKGLEFPVVALVNLQSQGKTRGDNEMVIADRFIHFSDPESVEAKAWHGVLFEENPKQGQGDRIYSMAKKLEFDELARIFYVGLTRAQDTLYLTATIKETEGEKPNKNSLLQWVAQALNLDSEQKISVKKYHEAANHLGIPFFAGSDGVVENEFAQALPSVPPLLADPVCVLPVNPVLAMGKLIGLRKLWNDDPTGKMWADRFVYFVSPFIGASDFGPKEGDIRVPGTVVGTLVHRALELATPGRGPITLDWLVGLQTALAEDEDIDPLEVAKEALSILQSPKLADHPEIEALVNASGRSEVDLVLPLGPWRLTGRLDKVFAAMESGGPSFVDWKTDHSAPEKIEETYRPIMKLYALALAKALPTLPPCVTARLVCLRHAIIRTMVFDTKQLMQTETEWTSLLETWRERQAALTNQA